MSAGDEAARGAGHAPEDGPRHRSGWGAGLAAALARVPAGEDLVATGADLRPATLLDAYGLGLFPMGLGGGGRRPLGWWSPDPRGVLPLDGLHVSRSLRRSRARLHVTVGTAFDDVVEGCADPSRSGRWITREVRAAYSRLHALGHATSVEVRDHDGVLVGGLYGVLLGGLFAGESMFSRRTDASKVAVAALVDLLRADGADGRGRLLDVQWRTDHLATLGVVDVPRVEYLERLADATALPPPPALAVPVTTPDGAPPHGPRTPPVG